MQSVPFQRETESASLAGGRKVLALLKPSQRRQGILRRLGKGPHKRRLKVRQEKTPGRKGLAEKPPRQQTRLGCAENQQTPNPPVAANDGR